MRCIHEAKHGRLCKYLTNGKELNPLQRNIWDGKDCGFQRECLREEAEHLAVCAQLCAYECSLGTSDSPTPSTFSDANVFTTQLGHFQRLHSNAHAFLTIKMLRFPFKQQKLNNRVNSGDKKSRIFFFLLCYLIWQEMAC